LFDNPSGLQSLFFSGSFAKNEKRNENEAFMKGYGNILIHAMPNEKKSLIDNDKKRSNTQVLFSRVPLF